MELAPSLAESVRFADLNPEKLNVAFEADGKGHIRIPDRHQVKVSDGRKMAPWAVPSLRELFRGSGTPPPDIDHYPPEYVPYFLRVEFPVLTVCNVMGDRSDQELEEIYSTLRRRPDGRSLGALHDFLWQVSALLLGSFPLNEAQFEAITGQLERSVRKWALRPISRFYVGYLRQTIGAV